VTEAEPTIKLYDEARWAELEDARSAPVELSLALFDSLRQLCLQFFQSISPAIGPASSIIRSEAF